jgi:periplasmic protein CpxP/Spy
MSDAESQCTKYSDIAWSKYKNFFNSPAIRVKILPQILVKVGNIMNIRKKIATLALILAITPLAIRAQGTRAPQPSPQGQSDRDDREVNNRLEKLTKQLKLTDEQRAAIAPIMKDEVTQVRAVKENNGLSKKAKNDQVREVYKSMEPKIQAQMTPEQQKKFVNLVERPQDDEDAQLQQQQKAAFHPHH